MKPKIEDPEDAFRFAAVAAFMGNSDRVLLHTNRLICTIPPSPWSKEPDDDPVEFTTISVNLDEMVDRGILSRVEDGDARCYAYTPAGRKVCEDLLETLE